MDLRASAGVTGREGTMLGPYQLIRSLGRGGAGEVYLAQGPGRDRQPGEVAVKVLHGDAHDPAARALAQQAQTMAELADPHALPVYAVGQAGDTLYVAMAAAPGRSLETQMRSAHESGLWLPLDHLPAARVVADLGRVLQAAHTHGVVHGDLTPANLFVRSRADIGLRVAVADFGQGMVVQAAARAAASGAEWAVARLWCAAPEQLSGPATPASDQYALATIAYLLLTGRYPFSGNARTLPTALLREPPPPPARFNPALSRAAEAALLRGLEKTPEARFPTATAFARALCEALATEMSSAPAPPREWGGVPAGEGVHPYAATDGRGGRAVGGRSYETVDGRAGESAAEDGPPYGPLDGRANGGEGPGMHGDGSAGQGAPVGSGAGGSAGHGATAGASFKPTGIAVVDRALARVDGVSGGRAGALLHVGSYLLSGGFAALVNLIGLHLLYDVLQLAVPDQVHFLIAYTLASEASIVANFIPNDRFTFSRLPGHARSWWVRCLRFHSTCIAGTLLTLVISDTLHFWLGFPALIGQAIAILIALIFNFSMHHLWTYRHLRLGA
jgi:putative flippase GtrA